MLTTHINLFSKCILTLKSSRFLDPLAWSRSLHFRYEAFDLNDITSRNFLRASFSIMLCLFALHLIRQWLKKPQNPYSIPVVQALSVIFTPVSVAWPLPFISFFGESTFREPRCIELDILEVIGNICTGCIELRDSDDLLYLFQDNLLVYGLKVKARTKKLWSLKTAIWTSAQLLKPPLPSGDSKESVYLSSSATLEVWSEGHIDLDLISFLHLKSTILRIQSTLRPGASMIVDFSCLSDQVNILTSNFLLCAIPFLPFLSEQKKGHRKSRKATPLFISVQEVISRLSIMHIRIQSVQDISLQHAAGLLAVEKDLVSDKALRMAHIAAVGLQGWREDRLMLVWEAGLLGSGLLTRWRIIVK